MLAIKWDFSVNFHDLSSVDLENLPFHKRYHRNEVENSEASSAPLTLWVSQWISEETIRTFYSFPGPFQHSSEPKYVICDTKYLKNHDFNYCPITLSTTFFFLKSGFYIIALASLKTSCVDQAGLKVTEILLPLSLPPACCTCATMLSSLFFLFIHFCPFSFFIWDRVSLCVLGWLQTVLPWPLTLGFPASTLLSARITGVSHMLAITFSGLYWYYLQRYPQSTYRLY